MRSFFINISQSFDIEIVFFYVESSIYGFSIIINNDDNYESSIFIIYLHEQACYNILRKYNST